MIILDILFRMISELLISLVSGIMTDPNYMFILVQMPLPAMMSELDLLIILYFPNMVIT